MNARDNPFATDRVERLLRFRPEWSGTRWKDIDQRWKNLGKRATLTGRHGSGKTTFLGAWQNRLAANGHEIIYLFFNRQDRSPTLAHWQALGDCQGKTILLDGEEQLNWRARMKLYRLARNADGLLVTRHNKGKLPTLLHFDPGIDVLKQCVQTLAPYHADQLSVHLPGWWRTDDGNIREVLLRCYDAVITLRRVPSPAAGSGPTEAKD